MTRAPFRRDDYAEIEAAYFSGFRAEGLVNADPSGWLSTYSDAERFSPHPVVPPGALARYYIDEGRSLGALKERMAALLSSWEARDIEPDEFTLCPSGACASLLVLAMMKRLGVSDVLFETPSYFGSISRQSCST